MEAEIDQKLKKMLWQASRIKHTFSTVMEASVISTETGSSWGLVDGGSVGAESNAWDSSLAPRAAWDAMLDNYEGTGSAIEYHYGKEMNCLPKQLTVSFYGASS